MSFFNLLNIGTHCSITDENTSTIFVGTDVAASAADMTAAAKLLTGAVAVSLVVVAAAVRTIYVAVTVATAAAIVYAVGTAAFGIPYSLCGNPPTQFIFVPTCPPHRRTLPP